MASELHQPGAYLGLLSLHGSDNPVSDAVIRIEEHGRLGQLISAEIMATLQAEGAPLDANIAIGGQAIPLRWFIVRCCLRGVLERIRTDNVVHVAMEDVAAQVRDTLHSGAGALHQGPGFTEAHRMFVEDASGVAAGDMLAAAEPKVTMGGLVLQEAPNTPEGWVALQQKLLHALVNDLVDECLEHVLQSDDGSGKNLMEQIALHEQLQSSGTPKEPEAESGDNAIPADLRRNLEYVVGQLGNIRELHTTRAEHCLESARIAEVDLKQICDDMNKNIIRHLH